MLEMKDLYLIMLEDRSMCESAMRKIPVKYKLEDLTYESDESESVEEISNALMRLSQLSLQEFLANEPGIYTDDDLKVRYR